MIEIIKRLAGVDKDKLTQTDRLILTAIYSMTNQDGIAWPGNKTLAKYAGIEPRSLRRRLAMLEMMGWLERSPRFDQRGRQTSNEYRLKDGEDTRDQEDRPVREEEDTRVQGRRTPGSPSHNGVELPTEPTRKNGKATALELETIYQAYPRRVGKKAAIKAIAKACTEIEPDRLQDIVGKYAQKCREDGTETRFIPHPATWFNQGRWEDEELHQIAHDTARADIAPEFRERLEVLIGHRTREIDLQEITETELDALEAAMPEEAIPEEMRPLYELRQPQSRFNREGWIRWKGDHPQLLLDADKAGA